MSDNTKTRPSRRRTALDVDPEDSIVLAAWDSWRGTFSKVVAATVHDLLSDGEPVAIRIKLEDGEKITGTVTGTVITHAGACLNVDPDPEDGKTFEPMLIAVDVIHAVMLG